MAQSSLLSNEDLKALDQLRQRLFQLTNNLSPLSSNTSSNTLAIINSNLKSVTDHLSEHADLLCRAVVYPQTNFPGRTHEHLLVQLTRKKLEPQAGVWVEQGRTLADSTAGLNPGEKGKGIEDLWKWASEWTAERVSLYAMHETGDQYTPEERKMGIENVNTGLIKDWGGDEEDEDEDEDDGGKRGGVEVTSVSTTGTGQVMFETGEIQKNPNGKARSAEGILRFAITGIAQDQAG